jgi:hypothetical protein
MGMSETFGDSQSNQPLNDALIPEPQPQGIMVHHVYHWIFKGCEHRVTCACTHLIGEQAYCVMCGEFKEIIEVETEIIRAK